jgi:S1-C subfamily serine protease/Tfp pilus assembly protein PilF
MKSLFLTILAFSVVAITAAQSRPGQGHGQTNVLSEEQIARKALASLVYVSAANASQQGGRTTYGTGFFIEGDLIITCYHIVVDAESLQVGPVSRGRPHRAILVQPGDDNDLAILRTEDDFRLPALMLAAKLPAIGERIYVASNPRGFMGSFTAGNVSGYRKLESGRFLMQISAPISPGSSGGAVLNTKAEVIGVVSATRPDAQNLNFAVPALEVRPLLKAAQNRESDPYNLLSARSAGSKPKVLRDIRSRDRGPDGKKGSASLGEPRPNRRGNMEEYWEQRISEAQQKVRASPKSAEAHFQLAETYRSALRKAESIQAYKEVISLRPKYAEAYCGLGQSYMLSIYSRVSNSTETGQVRGAAEAFKQAIRIKPDHVEAHIGLGEAYAYLGRLVEAIEATKVGIQIDPHNGEAYYSLGKLYDDAGRLSEAAEAYKQVLSINPTDSLRSQFCLTRLTEIYRLLRRYDEAITFGKSH